MPDLVRYLLGIVVAVTVVPLMFASGAFVFEGGAVRRREGERMQWADGGPQLVAVACASALAAYLFELMMNGADAMAALRWEVAAGLACLVAWSDAKSEVIPNGFVLVTVVCAVIVSVVQVGVEPFLLKVVVATSAIGAVIAGGVFLVSRVITRGGVGFGDVKLFLALGLLLGFKGVFNVLVYSMVTAFLYSVLNIVVRRKSMNDRVPLGPFVLVGVVVSIGFGA